MSHIVLKLAKDEDAYAIFSTVVDGIVTDVLTRDEMFNYLRKQDMHGYAEEIIEARLVRADLSGASDGGYGFDDGPVLFLDGGDSNIMVPRDELYAHVTNG